MSSPKKPTFNSVVSKFATPDRIKKTKSPDEEPGTDIIHTKTKAKHTSLPRDEYEENEYEQLAEIEENAFFPYSCTSASTTSRENATRICSRRFS